MRGRILKQIIGRAVFLHHDDHVADCAEEWEEVLLPEIERQQELGKAVVFRADAAFAARYFHAAWCARRHMTPVDKSPLHERTVPFD
jgi:hypothetical protein